MWNLKKNGTNELIYKTEIDSQTENKLMVTKVERGERDTLGIGRILTEESRLISVTPRHPA